MDAILEQLKSLEPEYKSLSQTFSDEMAERQATSSAHLSIVTDVLGKISEIKSKFAVELKSIQDSITSETSKFNDLKLFHSSEINSLMKKVGEIGAIISEKEKYLEEIGLRSVNNQSMYEQGLKAKVDMEEQIKQTSQNLFELNTQLGLAKKDMAGISLSKATLTTEVENLTIQRDTLKQSLVTMSNDISVLETRRNQIK